MANHLQSDASSYTLQQSPLTKSQGVSRNDRRSSQYSVPEQGQESDYHFHKTPLGLFESFFADTQQYHCSARARNNPGAILQNSPETSESESSDEDKDVTICKQDNDAVRERAAEMELVSPGSVLEFERKQIDTLDEFVDEIKEDQTPNSSFSSNADKNKTESSTERDVEQSTGLKKPDSVSEYDLLKERWFPDPWERPPGQLWTKEIQRQHDLKTAIRNSGFTGEHAAWLFNQATKCKGVDRVYERRPSLRRPGQTHAQYLAALKQRKQEEHRRDNQVEEYDEDTVAERIKKALALYDIIHRGGALDNADKAEASTTDHFMDVDNSDGEYEDEDSVSTCRRTRQHSSTAEVCYGDNVLTDKHGISMPPPGQRASPQEIEKSNQLFRARRAEVMGAARIRREEEELQEFRRAAVNNREFSNGYRERWREEE